jgi:site-specific DNA-methyltransferase (adenine-specific)
MLTVNKIYCGDCAMVMKEIDENIIDLTVTSPPYDDLRSYKGYSFNFEDIAKELYRVTKPGGVVVWVVGDATVNQSETGTSFRQALYFRELGFNLYDTMIYEKPGFTKPQTNRYHQIFEYMFVFSKGNVKTFNPIMDRPNIYAGWTCLGRNTARQVDGSLKEEKNNRPLIPEFGMRFNVWKMNTASQENVCKSNLRHPAMFPYALARDHILSWSNAGDLVLDPMAGSGTTCRAAKMLGRQYIGIDVAEEYCKMIEETLNNIPNNLF